MNRRPISGQTGALPKGVKLATGAVYPCTMALRLLSIFNFEWTYSPEHDLSARHWTGSRYQAAYCWVSEQLEVNCLQWVTLYTSVLDIELYVNVIPKNSWSYRIVLKRDFRNVRWYS